MGADCTFAHSTSELRPSPKPCFDFVKNGSLVETGNIVRDSPKQNRVVGQSIL